LIGWPDQSARAVPVGVSHSSTARGSLIMQRSGHDHQAVAACHQSGEESALFTSRPRITWKLAIA
jgi:hypothetical protein